MNRLFVCLAVLSSTSAALALEPVSPRSRLSHAASRSESDLLPPAPPALAAPRGGAFHLAASAFVLPTTGPLATLTPADPTVIQTLETPTLASVELPEDKKRTHVLLCLGGAHSWNRIASSAPYAFGGALRVYWSSPALPPPGDVRFGLGLPGNVSESMPSPQAIDYSSDPSPCVGLTPEVIAPFLEGPYGLDPDAALTLASELIQAGGTVRTTMRPRVRSVSAFTAHNAYLQVWSD